MLSSWIARILPHMPPSWVWPFSRRYIAGETLEQALDVCRELNESGAEVTIDLLGEDVHSDEQARHYRDQYIRILEQLGTQGIRGNVSLKPTMFCLKRDEERCLEHLSSIVARAAELGLFVRVDMEDVSCVDAEIMLFRRLHQRWPLHVGLVVQAYLYRTPADVAGLQDLTPLNLRLCKGIYRESPDVARQGRHEIRMAYLDLARKMLRHGIRVGLATHDRFLVDGCRELLDEFRASSEAYEFQMLYGVTPDLRADLLRQGHPLRVYVPFGRDWFGYSVRRLRENPTLVRHIIKALFIRG